MTTEEKAKRYDGALHAAKAQHNTFINTKEDKNLKQLLEMIFPELAESEDERVRKAQLDYWRSVGGKEWHGVPVQETIAWLEKHKPVEHLELKAGHWYVCYRAYCCRADSLTVREGERFMCEKDGVVKGFVIKDAEKYFKECNAPAPYEDEQKQKWTEEDDENFKSIDIVLFEYKNLSKEYYWKMMNWIKSLKQRMEE